MSMAPHCAYLRNGVKMGNFDMVDTMIKDGLWDAFNGYHMGNTAENVARQYQITRQEQDEFAVASQNKAEAAQKAARFKDEIAPVTVKSRKGDVVVDTDEYPRHGSDPRLVAQAAGLPSPRTVPSPPATPRASTTVLPPSCLMKASEAAKRGKTPLARIVSWAHAGVDPSIMGTGPIPASRAALEKAGWKIDDLDLVEANEAFAAQACAVNKELGWDTSKVNVNGGAIAIGHPIGASGGARAGDAAPRDAAPQFQEGPRHALHRRRHGHRHVRGAVDGQQTTEDGQNGHAHGPGSVIRVFHLSSDMNSGEKERQAVGRVALVTGGTRGIGAAICKALQAAGYKVAANYGGNDEAAQKFKAATGIPVYKWDVSSYEACVGGIKTGRGRSRPDRGAGQQCRHHPRHHVPPHEAGAVDAVINTNLNSLFNMCRPVIEGMRERKFGRIINISSINGQKGQMGQTNYSASKAGETRLHQGAGAGECAQRHHGQCHLPGLYRHRDGDGGARRTSWRRTSCRRSRSAGWANRTRWRAAWCSSPPTTPASSPARRSRRTAGR